MDVTDEAAVQQLIAGIGAEGKVLDVLVNTVGGYAGVKLWELDTRVLDQMLALGDACPVIERGFRRYIYNGAFPPLGHYLRRCRRQNETRRVRGIELTVTTAGLLRALAAHSGQLFPKGGLQDFRLSNNNCFLGQNKTTDTRWPPTDYGA